MTKVTLTPPKHYKDGIALYTQYISNHNIKVQQAHLKSLSLKKAIIMRAESNQNAILITHCNATSISNIN